MPISAPEAYVAAFEARCAAVADPGAERVVGPGIRGLVWADGQSGTQLLVLDDRGFGALRAVLPRASSGTIRVHEAASRCADLVGQQGRWIPKAVTAMVCHDLREVADVALPGGLSLRPVRRVDADPPDGVPLADAVAAARRSDPAGELSTAALATYLRTLPQRTRLLAAVDHAGTVRGTSGSRTFAAEAYVFFVNTDPGWRRRGVGLSMTAAALRLAAESGATRASLDASGAGVPLYRRLGFIAAAELTQFSRTS